MPKYLIKWVDSTEYCATVEADSREEAIKLFDSGELGCPIEPTGWVEMEDESVSVHEITGEWYCSVCGEPDTNHSFMPCDDGRWEDSRYRESCTGSDLF